MQNAVDFQKWNFISLVSRALWQRFAIAYQQKNVQFSGFFGWGSCSARYVEVLEDS